MNRVLHEADKRQREPILFVDDRGILRRFTRRGHVHEMLVVVGLIDVPFTNRLATGIWEVSTKNEAWTEAPTE